RLTDMGILHLNKEVTYPVPQSLATELRQGFPNFGGVTWIASFHDKLESLGQALDGWIVSVLNLRWIGSPCVSRNMFMIARHPSNIRRGEIGRNRLFSHFALDFNTKSGLSRPDTTTYSACGVK